MSKSLRVPGMQQQTMFDCRVCEIHIRDTVANNVRDYLPSSRSTRVYSLIRARNIEKPVLNGKIGRGGALQAPINKIRSSCVEQFGETNKVAAGQYSANKLAEGFAGACQLCHPRRVDQTGACQLGARPADREKINDMVATALTDTTLVETRRHPDRDRQFRPEGAHREVGIIRPLHDLRQQFHGVNCHAMGLFAIEQAQDRQPARATSSWVSPVPQFRHGDQVTVRVGNEVMSNELKAPHRHMLELA
ncbi:hypothetical protein [Bradyrhizobium sp. WSM471]|nr:hypothetical protein [Bradyrhizobium canariense]UFW43114.1 hypothetical protein BcanWSM471_08430 [Bradyrhizobium canariense]